MCRWRKLALEHLPHFSKVIIEADSHVDLWQSFKEVLSEAGSSESRKLEVKSIYDYAWWCFAESQDANLVAAVEAFFYEDLPVFTDFADQIPLYITPAQFDRLEHCFRYGILTEEEFVRFRLRYREARKDVP